MACPSCAYANDEMFRYCQQCGYKRKRAQDSEVGQELKKVIVQESDISERIQQHQSSRYVRQKSSLERELSNFLFSLSSPKSIVTALPADVVAFLVWKDRAGRTRVHQPECLRQASCQCPLRLAHGTVDSLIGKLRSIFAENGRGTEWQPLMGIGNPAADRSVKQYLANVKEEQLKARVVPRQAEPFLIGDLIKISEFILAQIKECVNSEPSKIYVLARDQAVFKSLFFAADRAADLLGLKTVDIRRFPDNSGFLFNHLWTKSLRSGDANVFDFKRGDNAVICPVKGLEMYFSICRLLKIELKAGYLFRSVTKEGKISFKALEPQAAQARLNEYTNAESVRGKLSSDRYTLHGFRSGAAISLALAGVSLHEIMDHVGWKNSRTALHYIKLKQVVNPAGAAAKLADLDCDIGRTYMRLNNLEGFSPVF